MLHPLGRTCGWEPKAPPSRTPRYAHVVYLCGPAAQLVVRRAARNQARQRLTGACARLAPGSAGKPGGE